MVNHDKKGPPTEKDGKLKVTTMVVGVILGIVVIWFLVETFFPMPFGKMAY